MAIDNRRGSTVIEAIGSMLLLLFVLPAIFVAVCAYASKIWLEHRLYQGLTRALTHESSNVIERLTETRLTRELPWGRVQKIRFTVTSGRQQWQTAFGSIDWCYRIRPSKCWRVTVAGELKEQNFLGRFSSQ